MTDIHSNHFQVAGNGKVACLNIKKAWNFPGFFLLKSVYSPGSEHSKFALSTEQRARFSTLIIEAS